MSERPFDAIVLGTGPAGLTAAYVLARNGRRVCLLEKADFVGGLMRSVDHGDFRVDIGRKELYNRIPEVNELWSELLGDDYCRYDHRIGVLYDKHIIERSRAFRGYRRGMPAKLILAGLLDYGVQRVTRPLLPPPVNEEEYRYRTRGRLFSIILSQGHKEKFGGRRWRDLPVPGADEQSERIQGSLGRRITVDDHDDTEWRHPAYSSGQIVQELEERIRSLGGTFVCNVEYQHINMDGQPFVAGRWEGEDREWAAGDIISTLRLPQLARLLGLRPPAEPQVEEAQKRSTVIVYLFLDEPARFAHCWLDVTDPGTPIGRVTNYAGFGGRMVPVGKGCLAAEIFLTGPDPFLARTDDEIADLVIEDLEKAGLVDSGRVSGRRVMRFPGAYAANDYRSWLEPEVQRLLGELRSHPRLFDTHRAGTDVATFAGLLAGEAIVKGDRQDFDARADPARPLGIESTRLGRRSGGGNRG